jgi:hypothetical protein
MYGPSIAPISLMLIGIGVLLFYFTFKKVKHQPFPAKAEEVQLEFKKYSLPQNFTLYALTSSLQQNVTLDVESAYLTRESILAGKRTIEMPQLREGSPVGVNELALMN